MLFFLHEFPFFLIFCVGTAHSEVCHKQLLSLSTCTIPGAEPHIKSHDDTLSARGKQPTFSYSACFREKLWICWGAQVTIKQTPQQSQLFLTLSATPVNSKFQISKLLNICSQQQQKKAYYWWDEFCLFLHSCCPPFFFNSFIYKLIYITITMILSIF